MNGDNIRLVFPAKSKYIMAIRLAVSAVASRAGFDVDDIEDLKVAAAEACIMFLNEKLISENLNISLDIKDDFIISVKPEGKFTKNTHTNTEGEDLSRYLLEALVEKVDFKMHNEQLKEILLYKHF